jgi:hypothetical protein
MPHTIAQVIRMREMIDGFYELPKDKRPPENIWFDNDALEEWFDRLYTNKENVFNLSIGEVEG